MIKKLAAAVVLILVVVAVVVLVRAASYSSVQVLPEPTEPIAIDDAGAAERLSAALKLQTISYGVVAPISKDEFESFHQLLETSYPKTHETLQREIIGGFSLLYTWKGSDDSKKPLLIIGHFDVVPVAPGSEREWKEPPFSGNIVDGVVWGRGAKDDKLNVIGAMEAVEWLIGQGFQPKRTVMLAFGHDEELGGRDGAVKIAALLKERGVDVECVVDEGGSIIEGVLPGVNIPTALIGIGEKGYLTLRLRVEQEGGHSSMPPEHSAVGILARAVSRLEDNPFPARIPQPTYDMFDQLGPEMPFKFRIVFANLWLFEPIIKQIFAGAPDTNAVIRTTTAVTMMNGGVKDNVLPTEATATVNFRILPGDTADSVIERVHAVIADERVTIEDFEKGPRDPSKISDVEAPAYKTLVKTIRQVCPDVIVGPYLVLGGTDARHYTDVTPNMYRFVPMRFKKGESSMLHGSNEWISVDNFGEVCRFYVQLIRNFNG